MSSLSLRRASASVLSLAALVARVAKWTELRRSRIALARLDAHLLKDVGLEPDVAALEARRGFGRI